MAQAHAQLRTAAPSPSPRTPEREALALAIERYARAKAALANIEAAKARAHTIRREASNAVEAAKGDLLEAKAAAPQQLVSRLLGGSDDVALRFNDVGFADAALAEAETDERLAEAAYKLLDDEIKNADREIEWSERRLHDARATALAADPVVATLIDEYASTQRRLAALRAYIAAVSSANGLPTEVARLWGSVPHVDFFLKDENWIRAIAALDTDADAPLPATV